MINLALAARRGWPASPDTAGLPGSPSRAIRETRRSLGLPLGGFAGDVAVATAALVAGVLICGRASRFPGPRRFCRSRTFDSPSGTVVLVAAAQAISLLALRPLRRPRAVSRAARRGCSLPALSSSSFCALSASSSSRSRRPTRSRDPCSCVYVAARTGSPLALWRAGARPALSAAAAARAIVVGSGPAAALVADTIRRHPWTGVELVGASETTGARSRSRASVGDIADLAEIVERDRRRRRDPDAGGAELARPASRTPCPRIPECDLLVWPSPFETMIGRLRFRIVGDLPLLEARVRPLGGRSASGSKRVFDVAAAAVMLRASPLRSCGLGSARRRWRRRAAASSIARRGREGRARLRPLEAADDAARRRDRDGRRARRAGRSARHGRRAASCVSARVDEIPQLWNVLARRHEPRRARGPSVPSSRSVRSARSPGYSLRHTVRPGADGPRADPRRLRAPNRRSSCATISPT